MKLALLLCTIVAALSQLHRDNHQATFYNVNDASVISYNIPINRLWAIPTGRALGNIKYMYVDSTMNLHLVYNMHNDSDIIFKFEKRWGYEYSFVHKITSSDIKKIILTIGLDGNIDRCQLFNVMQDEVKYHHDTGNNPLVQKLVWEFMANHVSVLCCANHNPRHCCTPIKQVKDTGRKYNCIWP